ncbi:ras association domain-containing protein 5 isoform X1 [Thalassophryne amazonica]|uniref:ras association domain-containing protein 5 isoform X1 n=1 Tax=Thalassophryne amazonica TaxID=390379 RepID=UPI001470D39D|nr:ras association domain-containing protein 5 isoform X1 [Thalassophryne amazonica]
MASVSVVGQQPGPHRLDSEPQLLLFKLPGKKISLTRKSSREKVMPRQRSGSSGDCGAPAVVTAGRMAAAGGAMMSAAGRGAPVGPAAPRSPAPCDSNVDCVCNRNGRTRRSGISDEALPLQRLTQGRTGVVRLARIEPPRREAWSIFPPEADPRVRTERGEGHRFETCPVTQDWCDFCSRQITARALRCRNCSYTCHLECEGQVQLDCNQRDRDPEKTPPPTRFGTTHHQENEAKEENDGGTKDLSEEEVRKRIEEYNAQDSDNLMNLAADGSYTGIIQVHLRLSRPVTVPAVETAGSEGGSRHTDSSNRSPTSEGQERTDCGQSEKRTSFYLPCDCVKQIHIGSHTTTREVIQGLLKKFMVLDNPQKFALYRQTHRDGQDLFQKLPLSERPLLLRLIAGPDPDQLSFVLKENETGEVEWHAFSVPELHNFLVILEKEEAERVRAVEQKYTVYRRKLQKALEQHNP